MALNLSVKIHPVVLFQIVDAYERRNADSHRVIGTLLGTTDKGVVEVTNCFCVPHKEHADQVEAELNYAMDVYELNRRVNSNESIVGWWATGNEVTNHSSVIHEYYSRECRAPVHVTLDTSLAGARMGLRAYKTTGGSGGRTRQVQPMMDLAQISDASSKLSSLLEQVLSYVEEVLAGGGGGDAATGRALLSLVNSVPNLSAEAFAD
ncbi:Eukaryotic translation initiation factor 3 subunit F, partial [Operophtera brumata]